MIIKYLYNNYMKTVIIVINILLLSLILYTLLSRGDKLIENMSGCPGQESWTKKCYGFISGAEACKRDFGSGTKFMGKEKACEYGGLDAQYLCKKKETAAQTNKKLLDRLYQEVAILDGETDDLNKRIKDVNGHAEKSEKKQKKFMSGVNDERKSMGKMMDGLPSMKPSKKLIKIGSVNSIGDLFNAMPLQGF